MAWSLKHVYAGLPYLYNMAHCTFEAAGRAGNFFFECATTLAYSIKHGLNFTVPLTTSNEFWSPIYVKHLQDHSFNPSLETIDLWENGHEYQDIPFEESWRDKNIVIRGYRQSAKYFEEYRDEILYLLDLPYELKPICSIHARYGDYLTIEGKHIIIDEEYIVKAMALIKEKTGLDRFKVFSDDLNLFKQRHGHLYDFEYSTNTNELSDLIEISCCHSQINSSSTFSWWGGWLNRNKEKVIITQEKWFQDGWMGLNTSDIVPSTWIKL